MSSDFSYKWPNSPLDTADGWFESGDGLFQCYDLSETPEQRVADFRWPALFPAPTCLVSTTNGKEVGLKKVAGPCIVNRFPYIAALSVEREETVGGQGIPACFSELLEEGGSVAIQFLPPDESLSSALSEILRKATTKPAMRPGQTVEAPILKDAYLVYEGNLVKPGKDFSGDPIFDQPWADVGSNRVYFIEITAIQLRADIAEGKAQIYWKGLPEWSADPSMPSPGGVTPRPGMAEHYQKGYTPRYKFPAANTVAFEFNETAHGMAIKHLPPLPEAQTEVDNDRARWPCFFPSPTAMITSWASDGQANIMPCGSTTIISRYPLIIAPCISYGRINERYAPRASLEMIRKGRTFGCGIPYISDALTDVIRYSGTTSFENDPDKIANSGLHVSKRKLAPQIDELPIHFECKLKGEMSLGTHIMFIGEVSSILVRKDLTEENPMSWSPWANVNLSKEDSRAAVQ